MMRLTLMMLMAFFVFACSSPTENDHEHDGDDQEQHEHSDGESEDGSAQTEEEPTGNFGEEITTEGIMTFADLKTTAETEGEAYGKIKGNIEACCQKKGCWMDVTLDDGSVVKVTFKDYGFFVPMNAAGHDVVMEGKAYLDTLDVDLLKHFAEDAGKTQEEIDAITEPEISINFEATGVKIL